MTMEAAAAARPIVAVIQRLARSRDEREVIEVVRSSIRRIVGCDGATFVLRDGADAYYVDEDAIGPLFRGRRFPLAACISGWAILHRQPAVVAEVRADPRVPASAYVDTFVRSLAIVPIRSEDPLGAIGAYWSAPHVATSVEIELLQVCADSASVALATIAKEHELERRVADRTAALRELVRELEMFAGAAAHDLSNPLTALRVHTSLLRDHDALLDPRARDVITSIETGVTRMSATLQDLLRLSRVSAAELSWARIDVASVCADVVARLRAATPSHRADVAIEPGLAMHADPRLLPYALENLLENAWKYSRDRRPARIAVRSVAGAPDQVLRVEDNGVGFEPALAERLFQPFQRLHGERFPGTGLGLVTVARVAAKHGGRVWAEASPGQGATFYLSIPASPPSRVAEQRADPPLTRS